MTNEQSKAPETTPETIEHDNGGQRLRFGMVVLYVRDLQRSIDFYRLLGLEISDPHPDRPVAAWNEDGAVRMILTTGPVAQRFDPGWSRPERTGYQQVIEFFADDDAAVDAIWKRMTASGHKGVSAPGHLLKPYATMVEDPDGNVILITHEPA